MSYQCDDTRKESVMGKEASSTLERQLSADELWFKATATGERACLPRSATQHFWHKGSAMAIDGRIDDLIEAGWGVLVSDCDPVAFQRWRCGALDCLTALVGSDHVYTRQIGIFVRQGGKRDLLVAGGILSAAKEQMAGTELAGTGQS
jgi:hypothetical protein